MWLPLVGDLAHNPGMFPDWESNQWTFGLQAGAQSTEPHQPRPKANLEVTEDGKIMRVGISACQIVDRFIA